MVFHNLTLCFSCFFLFLLPPVEFSLFVCARVCVCVCLASSDPHLPFGKASWGGGAKGFLRFQSRFQSRKIPPDALFSGVRRFVRCDNAHISKRKRRFLSIVAVAPAGIPCARACVSLIICARCVPGVANSSEHYARKKRLIM